MPDVDTIELANLTTTPIDISGWYITDSVADPFRYTIPDDSEIDSREYLSFDEVTLGFSFRGQAADNAFVIEPDATGKPIRFVDGVSYSATQNGVTLGRWDDGVGELFPMIDRSFDDENSGPLIGDVVISEVHYHPAAPVGIADDDLEFVELTNNSGVPLDLSQWQLARSVDFTIPTGFILPADSSLIVVGFDPATEAAKFDQFERTYSIPDNVEVLGPYSDATDPNADQLDDDGERLILQRPEDIFQLGLGYVLVDRVIYSDDGDWPTEADGAGRSLTRVDLRAYGDFASTWTAAIPTPGSLRIIGDVDGNQIVDDADIDQLCIAIKFGGNQAFDLNHDGAVNNDDVNYLIETVLGSVIGDSNLDGQFNSADFVAIFTAGEYEDEIDQNSGWAEGDWNCDGDFNSSDLVTAFTAGTFSRNAVAIDSPALPQVAAARRNEFVDREQDEQQRQFLPVQPVENPGVQILEPETVETIFAELKPLGDKSNEDDLLADIM